MPGTISRRSAVGLMGAGSLAGVLGSQLVDAGASAPAATAGSQGARLSAEGLADLGPVQVGAQLGRWTVTAVHPVEDGALRIGCKGADEREFVLEVLARDASPLAPRPLATTDGLAVYVCNGGDGWLPTQEEQGLAAMTLANVLSMSGKGGAIASLLTHADRVVTHHAKLMMGENLPQEA